MSDKQNKKDLPRGLQIDTTTGEGANIIMDETKEKIMVPKKKPIKAVLGAIALGALGSKALSKATKKSAVAKPNEEEYFSTKNNKVVDLYQKATGNAKMKLGGEVEVGKGGDYIKDLID